MSDISELSPIFWRRQSRLETRVTALEESQVLLIRAHLRAPAQTVTPSPARSPSWLKRGMAKTWEKLTREAISTILWWVAGKLTPIVLAWLTLGRPALRWLEEFVPLLLK